MPVAAAWRISNARRLRYWPDLTSRSRNGHESVTRDPRTRARDPTAGVSPAAPTGGEAAGPQGARACSPCVPALHPRSHAACRARVVYRRATRWYSTACSRAAAAVQGITALRRRPGTRLGLRPVLIPDEDFAKVVLRRLAGEAFEADERRHRAGAEALRQCHQRPRAAIVYPATSRPRSHRARA